MTYLESVMDSIEDAWDDYDGLEELYKKQEIGEIADEIKDGVTGNINGSFTFDRYQARQLVLANNAEGIVLASEFCDEFEIKLIKDHDINWERIDVLARLAVFDEALQKFLENKKISQKE